LWWTALLRATALPFLMIGLLGAAAGPSFDMAVAPTGEAVAYRAADGKLAVIGRGRNAFATEQWLRADADGRPATEALAKSRCDKLGCVGTLGGGKIIALILDRAAFAEEGQAVTYTGSVKIGGPRPAKPQGKSMAGQSITGSTSAPATAPRA
jgi:competence protein ComEC